MKLKTHPVAAGVAIAILAAFLVLLPPAPASVVCNAAEPTDTPTPTSTATPTATNTTTPTPADTSTAMPTTTVRVNPAWQEATIGEELTVDIVAENVVDLSWWQVTITFNGSILRFQDWEDGPWGSDGGILTSATFLPIGTGTSELTLDVLLLDSTDAVIPAGTQDGSVTVVSASTETPAPTDTATPLDTATPVPTSAPHHRSTTATNTPVPTSSPAATPTTRNGREPAPPQAPVEGPVPSSTPNGGVADVGTLLAPNTGSGPTAKNGMPNVALATLLGALAAALALAGRAINRQRY